MKTYDNSLKIAECSAMGTSCQSPVVSCPPLLSSCELSAVSDTNLQTHLKNNDLSIVAEIEERVGKVWRVGEQTNERWMAESDDGGKWWRKVMAESRQLICHYERSEESALPDN